MDKYIEEENMKNVFYKSLIRKNKFYFLFLKRIILDKEKHILFIKQELGFGNQAL